MLGKWYSSKMYARNFPNVQKQIIPYCLKVAQEPVPQSYLFLWYKWTSNSTCRFNIYIYIHTYNDLPKFTQITKKQADYKYLHVWVTTQLTINKSVWDKDVQGARWQWYILSDAPPLITIDLLSVLGFNAKEEFLLSHIHCK